MFQGNKRLNYITGDLPYRETQPWTYFSSGEELQMKFPNTNKVSSLSIYSKIFVFNASF